MASVNELAIVSGLIPEGRSHTRVNCPFCGGKSTLSISRIHGNLLWNCHRASCDTGGREKGHRTLDDMRTLLGRTLAPKAVEFELPEHLTNVLGNEDAVLYLRKNNCMVAYSKRLADIRYDPKQNRVVFVSRHKNKLVGATGRALTKGVFPKWYRYDTNQYPFVAGEHSTAILVEDAASACAVAPIATGIALMGTNLSHSYVGLLRNYNQIIVALDPDAQRKGIDMERLLSYYAPTRTALITNDLKYFTSTQIADMIGLS